MELPTRIDPDPVKEALVEIRFLPSPPTDAVFGLLFERFDDRYPEVEKLPILQLPEQAREEKFRFKPHYRLPGNPYMLQIGPRVLSIVNKGEYQGWQDFSSAVLNIFEDVHESGIIERVIRFGLRYTNFFEVNIFSELQLDIQSGERDLVGEDTYLKTLMEHDDELRSVLQIANSAQFQEGENPPSQGSIIDIDTFSDQLSERGFFEEAEQLLDSAHRYEKSLFFGLLTDEFLDSLNPEYSNGS